MSVIEARLADIGLVLPEPVAPIANYLLASLGFFCLLLWAAARGMFRDIERPKYDMLAQEEALDRKS